MRINIKRKDQHGSIYKKYINMIDKTLEKNLEKGKEQEQIWKRNIMIWSKLWLKKIRKWKRKIYIIIK